MHAPKTLGLVPQARDAYATKDGWLNKDGCSHFKNRPLQNTYMIFPFIIYIYIYMCVYIIKVYIININNHCSTHLPHIHPAIKAHYEEQYFGTLRTPVGCRNELVSNEWLLLGSRNLFAPNTPPETPRPHLKWFAMNLETHEAGSAKPSCYRCYIWAPPPPHFV